MNRELPDVQAGFRKGRGTRDQIANICWIIKKAGVPEKHVFLLYWLCQTFDCVDHNKLWKILQEMGIPDRLPTFENPLEGKEIWPVNPKGNQTWLFIGRTDAEAETPILWPPDALTH